MLAGVLVCLRCGSIQADVRCWKLDRGLPIALINCSQCGLTSVIQGFSIGRIDLSKEQEKAVIIDKAVPKALSCKR